MTRITSRLYIFGVLFILTLVTSSETTDPSSKNPMEGIGSVLEQVAKEIKAKLEGTANEIKKGAKGHLDLVSELEKDVDEKGIILEEKLANRTRRINSTRYLRRKLVPRRRLYCSLKNPKA